MRQSGSAERTREMDTGERLVEVDICLYEIGPAMAWVMEKDIVTCFVEVVMFPYGIGHA